MIYYEEVIKALNKNKVKFAVAGGVAVVLHGFNRFTADIDFIVKLNRANLEKFFDTLCGLNYRPKVPVKKEEFISKKKRQEWIKNKGMVVFSFFHLKDHLKLIDVFVQEPISFSEIEKKLEKIKIDDLIIPTVCIEHLKRLKLMASRFQDMLDVRNLEEIQRIKNEQGKEG